MPWTLKITAMVVSVLTVLVLYSGLVSELLQICEASAHTGGDDAAEHCKPWLRHLLGIGLPEIIDPK